MKTIFSLFLGFHSINVPSEWGRVLTTQLLQQFNISFHSINVPSEWGQTATNSSSREILRVSIQLMSPASGDLLKNPPVLPSPCLRVSIQLMSPASGDSIMLEIVHILEKVSIQLMSPASGDLTAPLQLLVL